MKISQNSLESNCVELSLLTKLQVQSVILAQVFSCEFWEIFKNTFFTELLWMTASGNENILARNQED